MITPEHLQAFFLLLFHTCTFVADPHGKPVCVYETAAALRVKKQAIFYELK